MQPKNESMPEGYLDIVETEKPDLDFFSDDFSKLNANAPDGYVSFDSQTKTYPQTFPKNKQIVDQENAEHYDDLNEDAVSLLKSEKQSYESIKNNQEINDAAVRFAQNHLGKDDISPEDALDLALEHFNKFDVNELTAINDFGYVSSLKADMENYAGVNEETYQDRVQQMNDYRLLFTAKNSLPYFFQEGGRGMTAVGDVLEGIAKAPSTWLGLLIPVLGKGAAVGGTQATKLGISKILQQVGTRQVLGAVAIEATAGAAQDIAAQNAQIDAQLKDDYSYLQTGAVTAISGILPAALVPLSIKGQTVAYAERNTGDIFEVGKKTIEDRIKKADELATETMDKNKSITKDLEAKLKSLDPIMVEKGNIKVKGIAQASGLDDDLRLGIKSEKYKQVMGALIEITKIAGKAPARINEKTGKLEKERISETVARAIAKIKAKKGTSEEVIDKSFSKILKDYNLNYGDLSSIFVADASEAGRILQQRGQLSKEMNAFRESMEEALNFDYFKFSKEQKEEISKLSKKNVRDYFDNTLTGKGLQVAKELDSARLAFMTSQPATTVRNILGGVIRLPMDAVVRGIDTSLQKITGVERLTPNSDAWGVMGGFLNSAEAKAVQKMFKFEFAEQSDAVFRPLLDLADAAKKDIKLQKLAKLSRGVNYINTLSDNWFKRAALTGNLKRELNDLATQLKKFSPEEYKKRFGKDFKQEDFELRGIIERGEFAKIFNETKEGRDAMQRAIENTLYFTYQRSPDNPLAKAFIQGVHSVPFFATSIAPFPRFMVNAMRFTYEHSPAFLMIDSRARMQFASLLGNKTARELTEGYEEISKGLLGTSYLMGATAFRMSEHAGGNWWDMKTEDGRTVDLRPLFPLAPYLYFGDLLARKLKGEPVTPESNSKLFRETVANVTGMQAFKTGFAAYSFEKMIQEFDEGDPERFHKLGVNLVANALETYTIPATVPQDAYNALFGDDNARILKSSESKDLFSMFINQSTKRLPGNDYIYDFMEKINPNYERPVPLTSPFKEGVIRRPDAIRRQLTGLLARERATLVEEEFVRLKIPKNTLSRYTTNPEFNNLNNYLAFRFISTPLHDYITSDEYKNLEATENLTLSQVQRIMLKDRIKTFKKERDRFVRDLDEGSRAKDVISFFKFDRQPKYIQRVAKNTYHEMINPETGEPFGVPENDDMYNFTILHKLALEAGGATINPFPD